MKTETTLTIKSKNIKSSALYSVYFTASETDPTVGTLKVTFRQKDGSKGKTYTYAGVALLNVTGLLKEVGKGESVGKAFAKYVRNTYKHVAA